jgi:hypothetical protein
VLILLVGGRHFKYITKIENDIKSAVIRAEPSAKREREGEREGEVERWNG